MQLVSLILIRGIVIYPVDSTIHLLNNRGLGPVVQKVNSAIQRIAQLVSLILICGIVIYPVDSAIHRINLYPVESAICFPNTYPLDRNLSDG